MEEATHAGNAGSLVAARKTLETAIATIKESISKEDEFCEGLLVDLQKCLEGLKDQRSYETKGNQMLQNNFNAHFMQRSSNVQMASQAVYQVLGTAFFSYHCRPVQESRCRWPNNRFFDSEICTLDNRKSK